ncbi:MAG: hypothetical protein NTY65_04165 [Planctomycetota bacterium]|nr:hypothetical protein [Planctomycetota bacterium]
MFCGGILAADRGGGGEAAMFLKRLERRKDGKRHTYWALVESVRTAGTSRHRVVAYLGGLGPREQSGWAHLAQRLDGKDRPQPSLFDPPPLDEPSDDEPVLVNLKGVRLERVKRADVDERAARPARIAARIAGLLMVCPFFATESLNTTLS